ncbi:restriction endonuclease subunit S, partial [Neisseria gonorrhoeae]
KTQENYFRNIGSKMQMPQIATPDTDNYKIPIPSLETQQKIVKILDKFTELEATLEAELALRKRQYRYYRDLLLDFDNQIGGDS